MPKTVDALPGGSLGDMDWNEYLNGDVWHWTIDEVNELGVKVESIRAVAHTKASEAGVRVKTRLNDDGLFIQAVGHP